MGTSSSARRLDAHGGCVRCTSRRTGPALAHFNEEVVVDWQRFKAALIRAWWAFVFPMVGALVLYFADPAVLEEAGLSSALLVAVVSSLLYGLKKLFWPDTTL